MTDADARDISAGAVCLNYNIQIIKSQGKNEKSFVLQLRRRPSPS
jgi:hypothetical protein